MRAYPKNRKGVSGKPFPRITEHRLDCGWCGHQQDPKTVVAFFNKHSVSGTKVSYACDHCTRRLIIWRSTGGFYSAYQADKARYLRHVQRKTNRI